MSADAIYERADTIELPLSDLPAIWRREFGGKPVGCADFTYVNLLVLGEEVCDALSLRGGSLPLRKITESVRADLLNEARVALHRPEVFERALELVRTKIIFAIVSAVEVHDFPARRVPTRPSIPGQPGVKVSSPLSDEAADRFCREMGINPDKGDFKF